MSEKINNVRKATIELTLKDGYDKLSIRKIAKKAGVSTGYLYRYYDGKQDLIRDIVESKFSIFKDQLEKLNEEYKSFSKVMEVYIKLLFRFVKEDRMTVEFLSKIVLDGEIITETGEEHMKNQERFLRDIYEKGIKSGCIKEKKLTFPLFLSVFLTLPFGYLVESFKLEKLGLGTIEVLFNEEVEGKLLAICLDALK